MRQVVIVDIDGTISDCSARIKYLEQKNWDAFYDACGNDTPITPICTLVNNLAKDYDIAFISGRRESCRAVTEMWVAHYVGHFHSKRFFFRKDGDVRHDTIVKPELFEASGIPKDNVAFILEDRNAMVARWRELGSTCLQVADGNF